MSLQKVAYEARITMEEMKSCYTHRLAKEACENLPMDHEEWGAMSQQDENEMCHGCAWDYKKQEARISLHVDWNEEMHLEGYLYWKTEPLDMHQEVQEDGSLALEPQHVFNEDDLGMWALHMKGNISLGKPEWKQFKGIVERDKTKEEMTQIGSGYRNMDWKSSMMLEMAGLHKHKNLKDLRNNVAQPEGYAAKHGDRHKIRLIAEGYLTDVLLDSVYHRPLLVHSIYHNNMENCLWKVLKKIEERDKDKHILLVWLLRNNNFGSGNVDRTSDGREQVHFMDWKAKHPDLHYSISAKKTTNGELTCLET